MSKAGKDSENLDSSSYIAFVKNKKVIFKHLGQGYVPPFKFVTSVSVIPFLKNGDIVAVRLRHRGIDIPGGHVESNETSPIETMNREAMEEACITVCDPKLVEVVETDFFDHPSYMLIYGAFVDTLHEFQTPDSEVSDERAIISQDDFIQQYEAGDRRLMGVAVNRAWKQLNSIDA